MEHLLGWGGDEQQKTYGPLRDRHGNEWGKWADDVEEKVPEAVAPAAGQLLDWIFGSKHSENPTTSDWAGIRPRPYRGATADPSGPAQERAEYEKRLRDERMALESGQEQQMATEAMRNRKKEEEKNLQFKEQSKINAENNRLAFFGRPAQKLRLQKRELQLERNDKEWQCCIFKHLETDIEAEIKLQKRRAGEERNKKNVAANKAANLRAKERGARAAEKGLNMCGEQLEDAKKVSSEAADKYAAEALVQEELARAAKILEEEADELVSQEEEKLRCVQAQIKSLKWQAKGVLDMCYDLEVKEIEAVIAEEKVVEQSLVDANNRLKQLPDGNPAWVDTKNRIYELERRLDQLLMEKRMFVPMFTEFTKQDIEALEKAAPASKEYLGMELVFETVEIEKPPGAAKRRGHSWRLLETPKQREFVWIHIEQKPGMIGLGRGRVGDLTERQKVVREKEKNEENDLDAKETHEGLNEFGLTDFFLPPKKGQKSYWQKVAQTDTSPAEYLEIDTCNAAPYLRIRNTHLAKPPFKYLSRKDYDAGETEARDILDQDKFLELFQKDQRHEAHYDMPDYKIKLRFPVTFAWATTWVGKASQDFFLQKKRTFPRKNKPISHTLGPRKLGYEDVIVPGMHHDDKPGDIEEPKDRLPRLIGTIHEWRVPFGTPVTENQLLALVAVEDERLRGTNERYEPDPTKKKHYDKYLHPEKGDSAAASKDGKAVSRDAGAHQAEMSLLQVKAPKAGTLVGIMLGNRQLNTKYKVKSFQHETKVKSFEPIAWIDCGKKDWEKCLLPIDEWPDA